MKEEELKNKWLDYELYLFILPYVILYGKEYIQDRENSKWLRWEFEREWKRKSKEEKQERFDKFYKMLQEVEDNDE